MFPLSFLFFDLSFACSLTTERSTVTNECGLEAVTGLIFFCFLSGGLHDVNEGAWNVNG